MKIDLVLTYVDSNKTSWRSNYIKIFNESPKTKFRGNEEFFKFSLRSICKYMPWLNTIYLIVSDHTEVPSWIDETEIKIITHDEFIPKEYLPTFNSCTIELFEYLIPGLSDYFIISNDDFYCIDYLQPEDFFTADGLPKISWWNTAIEGKNGTWLASIKNIYLHFNSNKAFKLPAHIYLPQVKQHWINLWAENTNYLKDSITNIREFKNINQYISVYYAYINNKYIDGNIKWDLYHLDKKDSYKFIVKLLLDHTLQAVCLNDIEYPKGEITVGSEEYDFLLAAFIKKFSDKCKFEK